jgi:hypothetical protein
MKKLFLALCLLGLCVPHSVASELTWGFKSPAFHHGNGYSTHVLSVEQLQFNRQEDIRKEQKAEQERLERELENTILSKFIRNLESRIYATLSKQMVDSMFADSCAEAEDPDTCTDPTSGTAEVEGATITWSRDTTTGSITLIVDGPDGYTEIEIPGAGEFNF